MNNYVSKVTVYIRGDNTAGIPDNSIHIDFNCDLFGGIVEAEEREHIRATLKAAFDEILDTGSYVEFEDERYKEE
jgi:hypothetical protein